MNFKKNIKYLVILTITILVLISLPARTNFSERLLRQVLVPQNGLIFRALFTPYDDIRKTLISLIDAEKEQIKLAIYFFTDANIASALIAAQKRGVKIEIITDQKHLEECPHTQIFRLNKANVKIYVFENQKNYGIFHHKFIVFNNNIDQKNFLMTGSFNFTNMAQEQNQENVIITDHAQVNLSYAKHFDLLKKQSQSIQAFIGQQLALKKTSKTKKSR